MFMVFSLFHRTDLTSELYYGSTIVFQEDASSLVVACAPVFSQWPYH